MENVLVHITKFINMMTIVDVVDILLVAFVVYKIIGMIKETRAGTLIKGILLLLVVMQLSSWLKLNTINYLLQNITQLSVFAILVVFQPEIRRLLDIVGRSRLNMDFFGSDEMADEDVIKRSINQVCQAAQIMSINRIGALIVFERSTKIGEIIRTGTIIDAEISGELIRNIFYPKSPLHDGAMIVRNGRIVAAACFLPLSERDNIARELGTRHRAALGMSECSDAVVVIVSEETGKISVAQNGEIVRNLSIKALSAMLIKALSLNEQKNKERKFVLWKGKNKDGESN